MVTSPWCSTQRSPPRMLWMHDVALFHVYSSSFHLQHSNDDTATNTSTSHRPNFRPIRTTRKHRPYIRAVFTGSAYWALIDNWRWRTVVFAVVNIAAVCQSPNSQFLQDWILPHWTQKATWQDKQLLTQHHSLCSQSRLHLWWTSYLFWSNFSHLQSLLLPYQAASSLYPSLPWFHHSVHHCHLHRSLQTWLL